MKPHRRLMSRFAGAFVVLPLIAVLAGFGPSARAETGTSASIRVTIDSPPSIAGNLAVRIFRGDVDVTSDLCIEDTDAPLPTWECTTTVAATYRIEASGSPPDIVVWGTCAGFGNGGALSLPLTWPISLGERYNCTGFVSEPGIILKRSVPSRPALAQSVDITDGSGRELPVECETDQRGDEREWCTGLPPDTYIVTATGVPEGYRGGAECRQAFRPFGALTADTTNEVDLSTSAPLWECTEVRAHAPLTVEPKWPATLRRTAEWIDDFSVTVSPVSGEYDPVACIPVDPFVDDPDRTEVSLQYECLRLEDGVHTLEFAGLPAGIDIDNACARVTVGEPFSRCSPRLTDNVEPPVPTTQATVPSTTMPPGTTSTLPTREPDPATVLPATGSSTPGLVPASFLVLFGGLGLVGIARRHLTH